MEKRQILNVINFIRGCEPRRPTDLYEPICRQIELMKKHNLKGTFLLQYDALIKEEYVDIMKSLDSEQFELGIWFELNQPHVEKAGCEWTGRFAWDWHVHCGFSVGYTNAEREKLVDVLFDKFKEVFGYFPKVVGSWFFDSHSYKYMCEKYELDAACSCKEQYGTDGYTLWGGYFSQGYYPSKENWFMPAQTLENQIGVPLFRMLGSDPVYQYDNGMDIGSDKPRVQSVCTLEPVYCGSGLYNTKGGGVPEWVDWYMKENFNGECLSFGYTQAGQENSFGWPLMEKGLTYQFGLFEQLQKEGKIVVEKFGETGKWYKETYKTTPASAIVAHSAFDDENKNSAWYNSKFYRINVHADNGSVRIRDLHVFSENYPEAYVENPCTSTKCEFETLPVFDGNRHSANGILGGGYITYTDGTTPYVNKVKFEELGDGAMRLSYGEITFELFEKSMKITAEKPFTLECKIGSTEHVPTVFERGENKLTLDYNGTKYSLDLKKGSFESDRVAKSDGNVLEVSFE